MSVEIKTPTNAEKKNIKSEHLKNCTIYSI